MLTPRMDVEYSSYPPQTLDPYLQRTKGYENQEQHPSDMALHTTEEMQQVPQARRPVPGNGNAFAQQARDEQLRQLRERDQPPPPPTHRP